jgi:hypothetical protein
LRKIGTLGVGNPYAIWKSKPFKLCVYQQLIILEEEDPIIDIMQKEYGKTI